MTQDQLEREILDQAYDARPNATADLSGWVRKGFAKAEVFEAAAARLAASHLVTRHGAGEFRVTVPLGENVAALFRLKPSLGFADLERIRELSAITPDQRTALGKIVSVIAQGGAPAQTALEVCRWMGLDLQS